MTHAPSHSCFRPMNLQIERVDWPYDPEFAALCDCYKVKAPRGATLYVQTIKRDMLVLFRAGEWWYTFSAGPNNERSHGGFIGQQPNAAAAITAAIASCEQLRVWRD